MVAKVIQTGSVREIEEMGCAGTVGGTESIDSDFAGCGFLQFFSEEMFQIFSVGRVPDVGHGRDVFQVIDVPTGFVRGPEMMC